MKRSDRLYALMQRLRDGQLHTAEAMAQGVVDIVNAKMADAIRTITIQRGIDPRDFSLVASGGIDEAPLVFLDQRTEAIVPTARAEQ